MTQSDPRTSAVTLIQIAKHTGLSRATVSGVLGPNADRFRPETRDRVLQVARELGYRPNRAAQAIRRGRFRTIGFLHSAGPREHNGLSATLLTALSQSLDRRGYSLTFATCDTRERAELPRLVTEAMSDGLLIFYDRMLTPRLEQRFAKLDLPLVWINVKRECDCVRPDDVGASRAITQELIARGHRRIAYVCWSYGPEAEHSPHYSAADRRRGYEDAMAEAGLAPRVIDGTWHPIEAWLDRADALLGDSRPPTAVVCYGAEAQALLFAAGQRGLRVPDDLSVATFGTRLENRFGQPVAGPYHDYGNLADTAVAMLEQKIEDASVAVEPRLVPMVMSLKGTIGDAP